MQFSEYQNQTWNAPNYNGRPDPFNFPTLSRKDCMALSSITQEKDGLKTTTSKFNSKRSCSNNLNTQDIQGKFQLLSFMLSF